MKRFEDETDRDGTARLCLDVGIRLVRLLRRAFREAPATIPLSGIRALSYVKDHPGASLSDVAVHLSVGAPTASKLVDDLVARGLMHRAADAADRRRLALEATAAGRRAVRQAARPGEDRLNALLERLSPKDRAAVRAGMEKLLPLLIAGDEATNG